MSEKTRSPSAPLGTFVCAWAMRILFEETRADPFSSTGASMESMNTTCLLGADEQIQVISKQMCGNGIVETGSSSERGSSIQLVLMMIPTTRRRL